MVWAQNPGDLGDRRCNPEDSEGFCQNSRLVARTRWAQSYSTAIANQDDNVWKRLKAAESSQSQWRSLFVSNPVKPSIQLKRCQWNAPSDKKKWPLYTGGIGTAAIFSIQASISVSLAHTAIRTSYLFLSPPIRALKTIRVSLTGSRTLQSLWSPPPQPFMKTSQSCHDSPGSCSSFLASEISASVNRN